MKKMQPKEYKSQRSVSVSLKEKKENNNQKERENLKNNNDIFFKGGHHRKRTSSYFLGSYLPDSNIINNNGNNEINPNMDKIYNNDNNKEEIKENEHNNELIYNLIDMENSNNLSLSFPSYEEGNNNSMIVKKEEQKKIENNNNLILETIKNSENSTKSFITFKNSLKYIKDKDERTTPSYQLALQAGKKEGNNFYVTSSNIIEEEKSSMIESKTELSNKKDIILLDDVKKEKEENNKNNLEEYINNININNNMNIYSGIIDDKNKMSLALNEIIKKNYKREEEKRKYLTQNKMTLLNTFYSIAKTLTKNGYKDNKIKENKIKKEKIINKDNNFKYLNDKINNNNNEYLAKNNYVRKFFKKSLNNVLAENEFQKNNLNNDNNIMETENTKKTKCKIPHLGYIKNVNQKIKNESPSNILITNSYKGVKTTNSSSRNNSLLSKKLNKIFIKNESSNRYNLHSLKRRENLNNALSFIREKKRNKINTDLDKRKYYSNNTYNYSGAKKINNITYTTSLTNSNLNTNNSNTQSHSKSKEKIQKNIKKSNSGSFNSKEEYSSQIIEDNIFFEDNKEKTIIYLKHKLLFNKTYEKIDALEKIKSNSSSSKNFFIILCEKKLNLNQYIFCGLFKLYKDKDKFMKIYGDEKNPNYILLKDIIEQKKYNIFEDNGFTNTINKYNLANHLKFTNNAMIIIKN